MNNYNKKKSVNKTASVNKEDSKIRLQKYLSDAGVCSRRKAEEYIVEGKVKVNGRVVDVLGSKVDAKKDIVVLDGKKVENTAEKKCIMLNKPIGYITTTNDEFSRPCVTDLIKEKERYYPIGRLDSETRGLLLLTNDGELANKITHPSKKIYKTYRVRVKEEITDEMLEKMENGIDLGDFVTAKAIVRLVSDTRKHLEIKIYEGKNRQIRRMCEALNLTVVDLKRVAIGNLELDKLPIGKYMVVNPLIIRKIFE